MSLFQADTEWEPALARFRAFGAAPSVAGYLDMFDPDGTVQHPGMPEPLRGAAIAAFITAALASVPDFTLTPVRWCARDEVVFVEARNTGTVAGHRVVWPSVYRLVTRAGRVLDGRSFYDRAAVLSHADAGLAGRRDEPHTTVLDGVAADAGHTAHIGDPRVVTGFLQPYAENWSAPQPERFAEFYLPDATMVEPAMRHPVGRSAITAHYRTLLADVTGLRLSLQRWAYRPGLLFAEWAGTGTSGKQSLSISQVDRFSLDGAGVRERVGYIDSLSIPTAGNARFTGGTIFGTR
jgi:ketosteroid isomerase-like protein